MGCINDKTETQNLPTHKESDPLENGEEIVPERHFPKGIAFEIPNNQIKIRKGKPNRWNKQLYIIREVSNMNHQLVQSPLKHHPPLEEKVENVAQNIQFEPVQVKQRKRTKTTKEHSTDSKRNGLGGDSKTITVDFIPEDKPQIEPVNKKPLFLQKRQENQQNRSHRSDNRSRPSQRYSDQIEGLQSKTKKKRKGSVSFSVSGGSQPTYRSIHFKRAKTFHGEQQLVHPVKSVSANKQKTDKITEKGPLLQKAVINSDDLQAQIKAAVQKNEEDPKLLELYHRLSQQSQINGNFQQAIDANAKYLKLARKLSGVDSCSYASGLSNLSSIYYSLQNYQKAIQSSMKAKSIKGYAAIDDPMHKARVLNEIGLIQLEQNHIKDATHYLVEVREIHGRVLKEFGISITEMLPETVSTSKEQYYGKSVNSMEVALRICLRVFGENHLQTANHLDDLGTSYCDAGRYSESLACFERCFDIMRRMRLTKHKNFETHSKHFFYNLEVIKLSANCKREVYGEAVKILENHFADNGFISEFKERMSV